MKYICYITVLIFICTPAYGHERKNKVRALDIHKLIAHIYAAQTSTAPKTRSDHLQQSLEIFERVQTKLNPNLQKSLTNGIKKLSSADAAQFELVAKEIGSGFELIRSPISLPDYTNGKTKYAKFCSGCHGSRGDGKGPMSHKFASTSLSLKKNYLSAFRCYNQNLAAPPSSGKAGLHNAIGDNSLWDACFYAMSRPHEPDPTQKITRSIPAELTLESLAIGTESDYKRWGMQHGFSERELRLLPFAANILRR